MSEESSSAPTGPTKPAGSRYQTPPDVYKPHRKPRMDLLYIPLAYGCTIPLMRFALQNRLSTPQLYKVYLGTVFLALGHAAWVTAKDSTV
ncbi:hypothetical protein FVE85_0204 [Porphyridium purpureum]|uniref:Uncharacterized protein n=1 Tax=Porphyridium purpureum TaxID=35688 RepID=A0A5J4YZC4_PORPP|nr:hypothetical protein FVE85_0204 [Porphyridium purpureum]|eukprot:POR5795..scf208_2